MTAGEDLNKVAAGHPSIYDFGWRQPAWKDGKILLGCKLNDCGVESGRRYEIDARISALPS